MYGELRQWAYVHLPPEYLGPGLYRKVQNEVLRLYEGKLIDGNYYVAVDQSTIDIMDNPVIQDGTCMTICKVEFSAVVFRPFKFEVMPIKAKQISKMGILSDFGPMRIFISKANLKNWRFESADTGLPDRFEKEKDPDTIIQEGTTLVVRLQGIRAETQGDFKFHAVATITEGAEGDNNLGPMRPRQALNQNEIDREGQMEEEDLFGAAETASQGGTSGGAFAESQGAFGMSGNTGFSGVQKSSATGGSRTAGAGFTAGGGNTGGFTPGIGNTPGGGTSGAPQTYQPDEDEDDYF